MATVQQQYPNGNQYNQYPQSVQSQQNARPVDRAQGPQRSQNVEFNEDPEDNRHFYLSFRTIKNIGCLILLVLFFFLIYVVVARPPQITGTLKDWLNAGVTMPVDKGYTLDSVLTDLNYQANSFTVGTNELVVSEDALRTLAKERLASFNLPELNIDIVDESMNFYWDLTPGGEEALLGVAGFKVVNDEIVLDYLGTPRIAIPSFLYPALQNSFLKLLNLSGQENFTNVTNILLPGVNVVGAKIENNELTLSVQVASGLEL